MASAFSYSNQNTGRYTQFPFLPHHFSSHTLSSDSQAHQFYLSDALGQVLSIPQLISAAIVKLFSLSLVSSLFKLYFKILQSGLLALKSDHFITLGKIFQ